MALVAPAIGYPNYMCMTVLHFPNGLAYLAGALKHAGHNVIGLNPNNDFDNPSAPAMLYYRLRLMIESERPQLIGLSGLCTDYHFIKDAIGFIRSIAPGIPIVCGGGMITHDAEFIFNQLQPDFAVMGEGEEVLCQLVRLLENDNDCFETIPNLWYWKNSSASFSFLNYDYPDLNSRAFPDYEPFGMRTIIEEYTLAQFYPIRYKRPYPKVMPIVAARSCPFKCTFCVHTQGPKYRARSMENILNEIKLNYEEYKFNVLFIVDELFAADRNRLREFCNGITYGRENFGWDFDWVFNTHASAAFNRDDLQMARDAGCSFFSYGIESASPKVLASMNKKIRPTQIAEAISLAEEVGIGFGGNFIFGDVAENSETIMESLEFFIEHCMDFFVSLLVVCTYPGSKLYEHCLDNKMLPDKLTYYETILQNNLTTMSDDVWTKWLMFFGVVYPATDIPFLKSVYAVSYYREPKEIQIEPGRSKAIWKVYFPCPHCAKAIFCRELIYDSDVEQETATFVTACPACSKRFNVRLKRHTGIYSPPLDRKIDAKVFREFAQNWNSSFFRIGTDLRS
ncbi:MAG: radical SAM protein [Desulfuromonadaceae bacterium]|nr:radical SAM protein [Desulfuromonadaceae bacterium]